MLFNSINFAVFLSLVFILYWFVFQRNLKLQNLFIVVTSYMFYSWWNWQKISNFEDRASNEYPEVLK